MSTRIMSSGSMVTLEITPDIRRLEAALTRLRDRTRLMAAAVEARKAVRAARWSEYYRRQKRRNR